MKMGDETPKSEVLISSFIEERYFFLQIGIDDF